jgi:alginate O-acetyltransferase complex protein AlgI
MTLSRFIRDYVYIPFGGNRKGHARTYVNLLASMIVCGLWHGAAWTFVLWGAYHGVLLLLHRYAVGERKLGGSNWFLASNPGLYCRILITQTLVFFGWMIFRADSPEDLMICLQKIVYFDFVFTPMQTAAVLGICGVLLAGFVIMCSRSLAGFTKKVLGYDYLTFCANLKVQYWWVYIAVFGASILFLSPAETPEFIYFAF